MTTLRALVCAALFAACSTPSVPIPPPEVDVTALGFTAPAMGEIVLTGKATPVHANAQFFIINYTTGDGVITRTAADGSFTSEAVPAVVGDTVQLQFEQANDVLSTIVCVQVVVGAALAGEDCPQP